MNTSALLNGSTSGLLNGNGVDFLNGGLVQTEHLPVESLQLNAESGATQLDADQVADEAIASTSADQPQLEASSSKASSSDQPELSYDNQFPALGKAEEGPAIKSAWFNAPMSNGLDGTDSGSVNNRVIRVRSSKITESFSIPAEERRSRGFLFNPSAKDHNESKVCAEISKQTGANIELYVSTDGAINFLITGKESQVQETKKKIASELQSQACYNLSVPREHYRFIFGKKGARLLEIEQKTGTKIHFPKQDADPSETIEIRGAKEDIEQAIHEIQMISADVLANHKETVPIEREYHAFISGPYNETVQRLQIESGARINIPPFSVSFFRSILPKHFLIFFFFFFGQVNKNEITITGEKSAVDKAKALVMEIYEQKKANCTTVSMVIKKPQHKYIIGPKGAALNDFFKDTGVFIEMPSDPTSEQINLRGEQAKIGPALALLYEKAHYVIEAEISVPDWIQRFLLGPKGENFNKLQAEFPNVQVTFESETNLVKMNGPRHEIEKAKEMFKQEIDEINELYKIRDMNVEARFHRFIIGKSGANINKIREETGARIFVPEEGSSNEQQVRIVGTDEAVAKAYEILTEIVQKAAKKEAEVSKELLIEHRFHGQIIGQKGDHIREIRDKYNVQINFPNASLRSDKVVIIGDKKNVDDCCKHLSELNQQLLLDNYRLELPVNKAFHKTVLGKEGAKIRKIRNETETRIDVSDESAKVPTFTISGKKNNVERARDLIQELEREELNLVRQEIIIPHKFHNSLIGANGRLIQSIEQECDNVNIYFPDAKSQSDKVAIRGTKEGVQKAKAQLLELSKDMQTNGYEEHLPCPRQYHRFIIGKGGNNINQLRDKYNFRILVQNEGEGIACDQITLIGKKENVLKAKQELQQLITSLQNTIESSVQVPQKYHFHFVNRKGQVIREISDEYNNVNISFPAKGATENPETVILKGSKECVEGAKERILEIVQNLESQITYHLEIDPSHHRHVLGYRASNLLPIEQKHDVKIRFPKKESEDTPPAVTDEERKARSTINIVGRNDNCEKAAQELLDLVPITIEFDVPFEYHGSIIGQKGQFLRNLRAEHNVEVSIPPSEEQSNTIRITACKSAIEIGKEAILDRVKHLDEQKAEREARNYKQELIVPHDYHNKIIGKKGAIINEIRKAYDVRINFPEKKPFDYKDEHGSSSSATTEGGEAADESGEPVEAVDNSRDTIVIVGYEKNVKNAIKRIMKIVRELQSQTSIQLKISKENYSTLIGRGGKTIRKIMDQFKVNIKFPTDDSDLVIVSGAEKNVEACKDHIYQIINDFVSFLYFAFFKNGKCCSFFWLNNFALFFVSGGRHHGTVSCSEKLFGESVCVANRTSRWIEQQQIVAQRFERNERRLFCPGRPVESSESNHHHREHRKWKQRISVDEHDWRRSEFTKSDLGSAF